ncbi:Suppressor of RPS4-RLD 1 [Camellia lanceoleosa]|uniref:Suppressor of RPS4-RLD 1 n=1 Tax=Camellia lanceoleosa TaxID=1840588 RepID=A0ACC0GMM8_9ERIC|nr:Suppressor of RPS4-RLD 1 [Camellia lanceoleosa]
MEDNGVAMWVGDIVEMSSYAPLFVNTNDRSVAFLKRGDSLVSLLKSGADRELEIIEQGLLISSYADSDAAIEDLSACVKLDKDNKSAYTYLGLALSSIGEHRRAEEAHMKSIQLDPSFLESWAHLT